MRLVVRGRRRMGDGRVKRRNVLTGVRMVVSLERYLSLVTMTIVDGISRMLGVVLVWTYISMLTVSV